MYLEIVESEGEGEDGLVLVLDMIILVIEELELLMV